MVCNGDNRIVFEREQNIVEKGEKVCSQHHSSPFSTMFSLVCFLFQQFFLQAEK